MVFFIAVLVSVSVSIGHICHEVSGLDSYSISGTLLYGPVVGILVAIAVFLVPELVQFMKQILIQTLKLGNGQYIGLNGHSLL